MKTTKLLSVLVSFALFTGCTTIPPQEPIGFTALEKDTQKLIISVTPPPPSSMEYPGANCLLCLGIAAAAHGKLSTQAKSLSNSELTDLGPEIKALMDEKGIANELLETPVNIRKLKKSKFLANDDARKDYRPLKASLNGSHLLVLDFGKAGFQRDYRSYIPQSDPYTLVLGSAYVVDLTTNKYLWFMPIYERNSVGADWKEPPSYPGLTDSFYKGIATVRDQVLTAVSGTSTPNKGEETVDEQAASGE